MSNQQHTPGDWTYRGRSADDTDPTPSWFEISAAGNYFADVHILTSQPDPGEAEANARVMCAAPKMLAALREAREFLRPLAVSGPTISLAAALTLMRVEQAIREAITAHNREDEA